jgi:tetratricopeptide (TPR) repeat protein
MGLVVLLVLLSVHLPSDCSDGARLYWQKHPRESLAALDGCKGSVEALFYMGLDHHGLGNHPEALKCLLAAFQGGYDSAWLLYSLVEEENELSQKAAGLEHFQLMLSRYPDSAWTHVLLGNAYFSTERDQEAQLEYEQALARDSKLPTVNFRLGYLAYRAAQYDSAARYFLHELDLDPSSASATLFYGQTLKVTGRNAEAIPYLQKAIALDRQSPLTYNTLAGALLEENRSEEAIALLLKAEKLFPADPVFPSRLSHLYSGLHRDDEARRAAGRAHVAIALQRKKRE